jgi:hypothetical protein
MTRRNTESQNHNKTVEPLGPGRCLLVIKPDETNTS